MSDSGVDALEALISYRLRALPDADKIAAEIVEAFIAECGGQLFYLSGRIHDKRAARDAALREAFTGDNHRGVAEQFVLCGGYWIPSNSREFSTLVSTTRA